MPMKTDYFGLIRGIIESTQQNDAFNLSELSNREIMKLLKISSANRVLFLLCKNIRQYNYLEKTNRLYPLIDKIFLQGQEINNHYASLLRKIKRLFGANSIDYLIVKTERQIDYVLSDIDILVEKKRFNKAREMVEEIATDTNICDEEARWHFKFEDGTQLDIHRIGEDWYSDDFFDTTDIWKNVEYREFLGDVYPFPVAQIEWILNTLNIMYEKWSITYLDFLFFQKSRNINRIEANKIAKDHGWDIGLQILNSYLNKLEEQIKQNSKDNTIMLPIMFSNIDFLKIFIARLFSPYKNYRISLYYFLYFFYCKIRFILRGKSRVPFYGSWFNFDNELGIEEAA